MKNNEQISHLIVGLLVKFKQIINSKDDKYLFLDNLSKGLIITRYYLQIWKIIIESILPKIPKNQLQYPTIERYLSIYEQNTRFSVNKKSI